MKIKNTLVMLSLAVAAFASHAGRIVTMDIAFNARTYDFVTKSYSDNVIPGVASVSFDVDMQTLTDYGTGSFIYYYGTNSPLNGAALSSSISTLIPQYVRDTVTPYNSYAFQYNYDYPSTFIENFGSRTDTGGTVDGQYYTTSLSIYTGMWGWQTPRNGDGTSDFFYTPDKVINFLKSGVGKDATFSQSYEVYTPIVGGGATYYDGKIWNDYSARITSVTVSSVPEPSTMLLALMGIGALGLLRKKSQYCI